MKGRSPSFYRFLSDTFLLAIPLVFFFQQTAVPAAYLFLILNGTAGLLCFCLPHKKTKPMLVWPLTALVMLGVFVADGSYSMYALFTFLTGFRLHKRLIQEDSEDDSRYAFILFLMLFSVSLIIGVVRLSPDELNRIYGIAFFALVYMILSGFFQQFRMASHKSVPIIERLFAILLALFIPIAAVSGFILSAGWLRLQTGLLLSRMLSFILIPLGNVGEKITAFLSSLNSTEEREQNLSNMSVSEPSITAREGLISLADGYIEGFLYVIVAAVLITLFVFWFRSGRFAEDNEKKKGTEAALTYSSAADYREDVEIADSEAKISQDLEAVREAFRQFEIAATAQGHTRFRSETPREWFERSGWRATPEFFRIYEAVRYGDESVSIRDAQLFLDTITFLTKNFSEKV